MADYDWRCGACDQAVPAGSSVCVHCGCPENANAAVAERHLKAYENSAEGRAQSVFRCPKCVHHLHIVGELRAAGGFFSAAFEVSTEKFKYIACRACGYTEFYRADLSIGSQVADLLVG